MQVGKYGWHDWTAYAAKHPGQMEDVRNLDLTDPRLNRRDGFRVKLYYSAQDFFVAEALEYVHALSRSTADNPVGFCGPVGPTEQLPLVAQIINDQNISVRDGFFAGMDEFIVDGKAINSACELSFKRCDLEMCFDRIKPELRMPDDHLIFPTEDVDTYKMYWNDSAFVWERTQGGQGNTKHFAFNDPLKADGDYADLPPTAEEYMTLETRIVKLHPATIIQDARHSNGGEEWLIPSDAVTVGPKEVIGESQAISIWHPGHHDNAFGVRLTTWMLANGLADSRVPMSMLSLHPDVTFHLLIPNIGKAGTDMK